MATYYKPQSPIQSGEDFIYPITTADQVKVDKDTRLNAVGVYLKNIDNSTDTTVYGNNATTLGGVAASDYALKTDTAPDSSKLGGKAPEYYIQPRNLLDNSDFLHPVNQRNKTSVSNNGYFIDRWIIYSKNEADRITSIDSNGLTTAGGSAVRQLVQAELVPKDMGEYTFAVCRSDGYIDFPNTWKDSNGNLVCPISSAGTYIWAALYEGSYTSDTLPPYVPKGYAAELAECQRHYCEIPSNTGFFGFFGSSGTVAYVYVDLPQELRVYNPSYTLEGQITMYFSGGSKASRTINSVDAHGKQIELRVAVDGAKSASIFNGYIGGGNLKLSADL